MTNSISFSSDLDRLFLVEDAQVVSFPLDSKKGIIIGKVQGQLVAATQKSDNLPKNTKDTEIILEQSQVQFYYSTQFDKAFIIIIDIDFNKDSDIAGRSYKTRTLTFNLEEENILLNRTKSKLLLKRIPLKNEVVDELVVKGAKKG